MAFRIESNLLDACALAILNRGDTYGYEITQEMKKAVNVSESTLYPVLRRLQQDKLCFTYDQPYQGRNRRYYSITPEGQAKLEEYRRMWTNYRDSIEFLLLREPENEQSVDDVSDNEQSADDASDSEQSADDVSDSEQSADEDGTENSEEVSVDDETVDITDSMETELKMNERGEDDE